MNKYTQIVLVSMLAAAFILAAVGLSMLFLRDFNQSSPPVGTAIGTQNVYASGLSDETKELVEDLQQKHYPFFYEVELDEWWAQQYPYIWFEDGTFYVTTEDVTWFIEMEKMEEGEDD